MKSSALVSLPLKLGLLIGAACQPGSSNDNNDKPTHCYVANYTKYNLASGVIISPWDDAEDMFEVSAWDIKTKSYNDTCGKADDIYNDTFTNDYIFSRITKNLLRQSRTIDGIAEAYDFDLVSIEDPFGTKHKSDTPNENISKGDLCASEEYAYTHYLDWDTKAFIMKWKYAYPNPKLKDVLLKKDPQACEVPED